MKYKNKLLSLAMVAGSLGGFASTASAQAPGGPLLATELSFEEKGPDRLGSWIADARLARYPAILRALRAQGVREAHLADDCSEGMPCNRYIKDEYMFGGTRLLSVLNSTSQFTGGAHGSFNVSHKIFDLRSGREIRFQDIFTSWDAARPILQEKVCTALRQMRPDSEIATCPEVGDLAFAPAEVEAIPVGGRATGFEVRTSDYQLGSYADGTEEAYFTLDARLHALIKPEYREDFRLLPTS